MAAQSGTPLTKQGRGRSVVRLEYHGGLHRYYDGAGQLYAYWDNVNGNQRMHIQHHDHLGRVLGQADPYGNAEANYVSLPWGDGYQVQGTDADSTHFAELDHDTESDTHHATFRQYNSNGSSWMNPDPYDGSYDFLNPQSFNRSSYVLNNPLGAIDPIGISVCYLSGPAFGLSTLMLYHDRNLASKIGSVESALYAGPGAIDRIAFWIGAASGLCP